MTRGKLGTGHIGTQALDKVTTYLGGHSATASSSTTTPPHLRMKDTACNGDNASIMGNASTIGDIAGDPMSDGTHGDTNDTTNTS